MNIFYTFEKKNKMIAFVKGRLIEKSPTELIIDVNGIGYQLHISLHTYSLIGTDENISLYTYLHVREDAHILFGFKEKLEREIFKLLMTVSGIGANTARNILSYIQPKELLSAIANEETKTIQSIKGIGLKTAQRMVIELKEKVIKIYDIAEENTLTASYNTEEAIAALEVLGFARKTAENAVKNALKQQPNADIEEIIKWSLKNI